MSIVELLIFMLIWLITLKLTGVVQWPWGWIFSPLWAFLLIFFGIGIYYL